jgi:hypothetical protein
MKPMPKSLWIACLSLGVAASCVESETAEDTPEDISLRETTQYRLYPVAIHPELDEQGLPIPGTLVLDTSEGKLDITHLVPERPREFESARAFHDWAVRTLNAKLVERDGQVGSTLDYAAAMTLRLDRNTGEYVRVDEPIDMIIGGVAGYIVIAGEQICVSRNAPCSREAGLAPPDGTAARFVWWIDNRFSGSFNVLGTTWIGRAPVLRHAVSNTSQIGGGFSIVWPPCWPGALVVCPTTSGSNFLSVRLFGTVYPANIFQTNSAFNTLSVSAGHLELGLHPYDELNAVCGEHFGSSGPDAVFFSTGWGPFNFPGNNC